MAIEFSRYDNELRCKGKCIQCGEEFEVQFTITSAAIYQVRCTTCHKLLFKEFLAPCITLPSS